MLWKTACVFVCVDSSPRLSEAPCLVAHRGACVEGEAEVNNRLAAT